MTITPLEARLEDRQLDLNHILLDANNPRLLGLDGYDGVPEERIAEPGVQAATLARLNDGTYDMESLRASIENSGLLKVDRIVVRPLQGDEYVVVEGNRRIAACKTLLAQHQAGERTLHDTVLESVVEPSVLVLDDANPAHARLSQWVIQGVRHISGIKPWGAYQAAKTIQAMTEGLGYSDEQVVAALSIPKARVRRSLKVLSAMEQMEENDDFGELAGPDLFGYFDEVLKRPKIRNWLGWDDASSKFSNVDHLEYFYSWITPDPELGSGERRLPASTSVRSLDSVIDDEIALSVLNTPGRSVQDAILASSPALEPEWREPVRRARKALDSLPTNVLEDLNTEDEQLIESVVAIAQRRLAMARTLASDKTLDEPPRA